jgi:hypothetical protein
MRPRYYFWYAFGFFTLLTAVDGVASLVEGPHRVSTVAAAPIYLLTGCFFSLVLWIELTCIAPFCRLWFQIEDTFFTALVAGMILPVFMVTIAYPISRMNVPQPLPLLFMLCLPIPSLWVGSLLVAKFSRKRSK